MMWMRNTFVGKKLLHVKVRLLWCGSQASVEIKQAWCKRQILSWAWGWILSGRLWRMTKANPQRMNSQIHLQSLADHIFLCLVHLYDDSSQSQTALQSDYYTSPITSTYQYIVVSLTTASFICIRYSSRLHKRHLTRALRGFWLMLLEGGYCYSAKQETSKEDFIWGKDPQFGVE